MEMQWKMIQMHKKWRMLRGTEGEGKGKGEGEGERVGFKLLTSFFTSLISR